MPSLLDELTGRYDERPWGFMRILDAPDANLTVKFLRVERGHRTSLQVHEHKDELLFIVKADGWGFVDVGGRKYFGAGMLVRIRPGTVHRVQGPLEYLEISTYDDNTDTVRLEDDYQRPC